MTTLFLALRTIRSALFVLAAICGIASLAHAAGGRGDSLDFTKTFDVKGEPAYLHFVARYAGPDGAQHQIEIWRDGENRLKRDTDGMVEILVERSAGSPEFSMEVLDLQRKIATRIDRNSFYRLGSFTDWFDLAHVLKQPVGAYELAHIERPAAASQPLENCQWYSLIQQGSETLICWSSQHHIPLEIKGKSTDWNVTWIDDRAIPPEVFVARDTGYVVNDASTDIDKD